MIEPIALPPLEGDCPDCPTAEQRQAADKTWEAWNTEESAAWEAFEADYRAKYPNGWDPYGAWQHTATYQALKEREPERLSDVGCVECDWTGKRLTDTGRSIIDLVRRYGLNPLRGQIDRRIGNQIHDLEYR